MGELLNELQGLICDYLIGNLAQHPRRWRGYSQRHVHSDMIKRSGEPIKEVQWWTPDLETASILDETFTVWPETLTMPK